MSPALLQLLFTGIPEVVRIVSDIRALHQKYPQLSPQQIMDAVGAITLQTDQRVDELLAQIEADAAAAKK